MLSRIVFDKYSIFTAVGFLARRRENEATAVYTAYMRIAN